MPRRLTLGAPAVDPLSLSSEERALDYARGIARRDQATPIKPVKGFDPFLFPVQQ